MKYIFILLMAVLASCNNADNPATKKAEIVSEIQLYEDSIIQAKEKQQELAGMKDHSEKMTLDNVDKIVKKREEMFLKNQKEIGELDSKIIWYKANIAALKSELRKY